MCNNQSNCDCSGDKDCDEVMCEVGVYNQHPSEVMGNRREGSASGVQLVCGGGEVGHCLLEPCIR